MYKMFLIFLMLFFLVGCIGTVEKPKATLLSISQGFNELLKEYKLKRPGLSAETQQQVEDWILEAAVLLNTWRGIVAGLQEGDAKMTMDEFLELKSKILLKLGEQYGNTSSRYHPGFDRCRYGFELSFAA